MFYGREDQIERFSTLWRKKVASFVVCRGRRRIGKSTLIERFAKCSSARFLKIEGLAPDESMTNRKQLDNFATRIARFSGRKRVTFENWSDAFEALSEIVDGRRTVILLDEISWMGGYDRTFPAQLKIAWDNLFNRRKNLVLFVCGSVSSWIYDNILKSRGFVGRIALDCVIDELPIKECVKFWGRRAGRIATSEIIDVLSVTGGIPRYLEEVDPALSADENIRRLCFLPDGYLFREFDELFNDVLSSRASDKAAVLKALCDGPANGTELAGRTGLERNGHFSAMLRELETAGFIVGGNGINPLNGRRGRLDRYRLKDNYTRFFLKYVAPRMQEIRQGAFEFVSVSALPGWNTIMGLQFENLVLNNFRELIPFLGMKGKLLVSAAPYRNSRESKGGGCQIDLLVQTERTAYVVEVKRKRFIDAEVVDEVATKIRRLPVRRGISVRPCLVYDGELSPAVVSQDYFDVLLSIKDLM